MLDLDFPPETEEEEEDVKVSSRSGTPEILDVNTILPYARADKGRPEGATITDKDSMMST